jgi:hypothetical protein
MTAPTPRTLQPFRVNPPTRDPAVRTDLSNATEISPLRLVGPLLVARTSSVLADVRPNVETVQKEQVTEPDPKALAVATSSATAGASSLVDDTSENVQLDMLDYLEKKMMHPSSQPESPEGPASVEKVASLPLNL